MTKEKISKFSSDPKTKQDLLSEIASLKRELAISKQHVQAGDQFNELVENVPDALILHDTSGKIVLVNEALCRSLGYTRKQLLCMNIRDIEVGRTPVDLQDIWHNMRETKSLMGRHRKHDGSEFPVEVRVSRFGTVKAPLFLALARDMTERTEIERKLTLARDSADFANRAKSDFLANMSHELRTPLNAIIGFSDMLIHETFGPIGDARNIEFVSSIHQAGGHLAQVIGDILDLSKIEANAVDLNEEEICPVTLILETAKLLLSVAAQAKVKVSTDVPTSLPDLRADRLRVKQVLINLYSNAIKFTPENGEIVLSARITDNCIEFAVRDTGIGVAKDAMKLILEPFGQVADSVKRDHGGTGLGLPISKSVMELHGGRLEIESTIGEGTTVTVSFPAERTIKK